VTKSDSWLARTPLQVRFRDLDAMGHVNNAVYLTYFEMGRVAYLDLLGLDDPSRSYVERFPFVIAQVTAWYRSPAVLEDELEVRVRIPKVRTKRFDFEYCIVSGRDQRLVAEGMSVQVGYDYETGTSASLPQKLVDRIVELEGSQVLEEV